MGFLLASSFMLASCLPYSSNLQMEKIPSPKSQLTFNGLHGVISQKIELFIGTAVRTSNPIGTVFVSLSGKDFYIFQEPLIFFWQEAANGQAPHLLRQNNTFSRQSAHKWW
jgi:hypothetical protein